METNNTEAVEPVINDPKAVLEALERAKSDAKKFREEKEKLEVDLNSRDQKIADFSGRLLHEKVLQLEDLKKDFPEIFDAKVRVGGQADTGVKASVSTQYSATEMQAAKILGKKI